MSDLALAEAGAGKCNITAWKTIKMRSIERLSG